jgi:hypothetical protein
MRRSAHEQNVRAGRLISKSTLRALSHGEKEAQSVWIRAHLRLQRATDAAQSTRATSRKFWPIFGPTKGRRERHWQVFTAAVDRFRGMQGCCQSAPEGDYAEQATWKRVTIWRCQRSGVAAGRDIRCILFSSFSLASRGAHLAQQETCGFVDAALPRRTTALFLARHFA